MTGHSVRTGVEVSLRHRGQDMDRQLVDVGIIDGDELNTRFHQLGEESEIS